MLHSVWTESDDVVHAAEAPEASTAACGVDGSPALYLAEAYDVDAPDFCRACRLILGPWSR